LEQFHVLFFGLRRVQNLMISSWTAIFKRLGTSQNKKQVRSNPGDPSLSV
jgi:hypothetical protein